MNTDLTATETQSRIADFWKTGERLKVISAEVIAGLKQIPDATVQCVVTNPPYWGLRSYLPKGHPLKHLEIGQEKVPDCGSRKSTVHSPQSIVGCGECYVCKMVAVFREIWRVLREDGTVWLNLGDSYANGGNGGGGSFAQNGNKAANQVNKNVAARTGTLRLPKGFKPKDLIGIPWRVALALQADGWYLRSDIVWAKPNCMPESVTDRPTRSHEYIFLLTKSARYFYDAEAIKEPCIYDVDGTGTAARKARAAEHQKGFPTAERNGIRSGGFKDATKYQNGKHVESDGNRHLTLPSPRSSGGEGDKQRGHSRRHDGFNARWDAMEKEEQCHGMRNKRDVWRIASEASLFDWLGKQFPDVLKEFQQQFKNKTTDWEISPANYPEAHFATFPPELILPCILAGTSAAGCCAQCGAPLKRKVEVGGRRAEQQKACGGDRNGEYHGASTKNHAEHGVQDASAVKARILEGMREHITTGWQATCKCHGNLTGESRDSGEQRTSANSAASGSAVPCIVLDPFGGSGTTGEVALELGRRAILVELNPNYLPLIDQRTKTVTPGLPLA